MLYRDLWRGRVWSARAMRVVEDQGALLALWVEPGAPCKLPASYLRGERNGLLEELASGTWELRDAVWRHTRLLTLIPSDRWYTISLFFDPAADRFSFWYVNFQRPCARTALGIDTCDLFLDLVVAPDHRFSYKDEDEFARARELGLITPEIDARVRSAAEQVIASIEARAFPFDGSWQRWRPDPVACAALPAGWDAAAPPGAPS